MTIKEVEQKTGLGRSNIRFYEKEKLINPSKNSSNGYKDYSQEDVNKIKKVAYLRTLGISVESIRSVISNEISLYEVVKCQSVKLEEQITELKNSKKMCDKMLQSDTLNFEVLNIEEYIINENEYWKKNKKLLGFDSVGFLYKWGNVVTWSVLLLFCIIVAILSYPKLPSEIPVQWNEGIATSWVNKYFIFAFPAACVLVRYILRPIMYNKLQMSTLHTGMITEYLANSFCLVILSVEVFTILFLVGVLKSIEIVLIVEAVILIGLLFIGMRKI